MAEYVKRIEDHVGLSHEKYYKTTLFRGDALLLGLNCLEPGQEQRPHTHEGQDKFYYVVEGHGRFQCGDDLLTASAGDLVWAPARVPHGVVNVGDGRLTLLMGIAPAPQG
jgi:quercetin dioxygenase-like cupin family protein